MFPRADLNTPRPLATSDTAAPVTPVTPARAATDARQEVFQRLAQLAIGRQVQADVLELLDERTFLVRVADTAVRMNLPAGTRVGTSIPMTFVAHEPRPTFLLDQPAGSTPASFSPAARLIDGILRSAQQHHFPATVAGKEPVMLPSPAPDTRQVATNLQDAVSHSGLFYEAHLQEWVAGSRPLAALANEPQAHLPHAARDAAGHAPAAMDTQSESTLGHALPRLGAGLRQLPGGADFLAQQIHEAQSQAAHGPAVDALAILRPEPPPSIDPEAARLVNQQLHALEQQRFLWQGELWPGQPMEWEIGEDTPQGDAGEAAEPAWNSVVRFELPSLGKISATIRLCGNRVQVQATAASPDAEAALRAHRAALALALDAAGTPLESLTVKRDEPA